MLPISSGCAIRPSGMRRRAWPAARGPFIVEVLIGVATAPGPTPTTRMLCGAEFHARRARQHAHSALREAVRCIARHRPVLVHGGDIDDAAAAALLDHLLRRQLGSEEGAFQIDGQHSLILRLGCIEDWRYASRHPALLTMMSTRPNALTAASTSFRKSSDLAHVGLHSDGPIPQRHDLLLQFLGRFRIHHVVDDDVGALLREFQ